MVTSLNEVNFPGIHGEFGFDLVGDFMGNQWLISSAKPLVFVVGVLRENHVTTLCIVRHFGWCYSSGPWFNMEMLSYQYRKSHWGDKTILQPSYLHNGISYTGKMTSLYWIRALDVPSSPHVILFLEWINIYQKHSNSFNSCIIIEIVQIFTSEYCQDLQVNLK